MILTCVDRVDEIRTKEPETGGRKHNSDGQISMDSQSVDTEPSLTIIFSLTFLISLSQQFSLFHYEFKITYIVY